MALTEKEINFLEEHIPELAALATAQAYWQALASGSSVLQYQEGGIYEVFPDGTQKLIKTLPPRPSIKIGQRVTIK